MINYPIMYKGTQAVRNPSEELFSLIKSLSKSEKGYFKKFSALHIIGKENKYIKLFDLIDKQRTYDETVIKRAFKGDQFAKELHVAKNYLYKTILKSLNHYYYDSTISVRINNLFNSALVLYRKGMFNESWKLLLKGKMHAYKYEKYESLLQILNLEKKLMVELYPRQEYSDKEMEIIAEKKEVNKRIFNIITFENELNKVNLHFRIIRTKGERDAYDKIIGMPQSLDKRDAEEFQSKLYFCRKLLKYNIAVTDELNALEWAKKLIQVLESNHEHIKEFTNEYVSALNICLTTILFLKKYDESNKIIKKLNSLKPLSLKLQNKIRLIIFNFTLTKYILKGEFEMGLKIIPQIEAHLKLLSYEEREFNEEIINYSLSYIYLGLEKYEKALEYINKILNDKDKNTKIDLLSFTHILNLIIHFELNNTELLPYIIKNTYRFLLGKRKLYNVEREVLTFIRKIPNLLTKKQQIEAFREIKENIIQITKDPYERIALDYFDFISWLESKIEGKKFSEVIKKRQTSDI